MFFTCFSYGSVFVFSYLGTWTKNKVLLQWALCDIYEFLVSFPSDVPIFCMVMCWQIFIVILGPQGPRMHLSNLRTYPIQLDSFVQLWSFRNSTWRGYLILTKEITIFFIWYVQDFCSMCATHNFISMSYKNQLVLDFFFDIFEHIVIYF